MARSCIIGVAGSQNERLLVFLEGLFLIMDRFFPWVNHLAVDPAYQGQDLGSRLMQELETRLAALGCEKVNLLIEPSNSGVQAFYGRLGFTADELIFMEKWMEPAHSAKKGV
nr:GNAT family N-acetyltransferase [Brevibacillus reuszeri]